LWGASKCLEKRLDLRAKRFKLSDEPNTVVFPRTISEEVVLLLKDVPVEMDVAGKQLENPEG